MKKGRHRRFEEARKLKQSGPEFLFSKDVSLASEIETKSSSDSDVDDDDYAAIARKYGAFDDEPSEDE